MAIVAVASLSAIGNVAAQDGPIRDKIRVCSTIKSDRDRLACFDELAREMEREDSAEAEDRVAWDHVVGDASILSSLEMRLAKATQEGRPALVFFSAEWAVLCAKLNRDVFSDSAVLDEVGRFDAIKVDLFGIDNVTGMELMLRYEIDSVPTVIFFDSKGRWHKELTLQLGDVTTYLNSMRSVH